MSSPGPYPPAHAPHPGYPPPGPRNQVGTWALVLAVVALLFSWSIIGGIVGGSVAVVLGFAGRARAARGEADNAPIANAGIGLGALAVIIGAAFVPIWIGLFSEAGMGDYVRCVEHAGNDRAAQQQCENAFLERVQRVYGLTEG